MTLSKQLVLLISLMFLMIFAINFYTSITNIRGYLEIESEIHAQDTATSLGLSLSPYVADEDDTILETMINAIFDRGYYLEILLVNPEGKELVRKTNPKSFADVPEWFITMLPMQTATASTSIQSGWVIGGDIYVTIHPGFGHLKLWEQAKDSLYYSAITLAISITFLILIIRLLLIPLGRINKLAISISDGQFNTIDQLPRTTDIKNVTISMNMMSNKLKQVVANLNTRLEETDKRLRVDELTGLETKGTFETEMKERFIQNQAGYVYILRIDDLGGFASQHSNQTVDRFIKDFVQAIQNALGNMQLSGEFLYRIVGAEFVLIAETNDKQMAEALCQNLVKSLTELGKQYDKQNVAHIGIAAFDPHGTTASMVSAATEAYEKARLIGENSYAISEGSSNSHDMDQWKILVSDVISEQRFEVTLAAKAHALDADTDDAEKTLVIEEAFAKVFDDTGESLPIGTFVSVAERLGKIHEFDMAIIKQVIDYIESDQVTHDVAINLSFASLASTGFRTSLYEVLKAHQDAAQRVAFSVTAYGATKDLSVFKTFIDFAHRNGAKVILKRFETRFMQLEQVKEFKLDYIRLARIYTENIGLDDEKHRLVQAMKELGDLLDVKIIAEAVESDQDYQAVKEIGLIAASR